eukprot:scaffold2324_cov266-Pinguiococcus_pyrenoidosus.AAC.2
MRRCATTSRFSRSFRRARKVCAERIGSGAPPAFFTWDSRPASMALVACTRSSSFCPKVSSSSSPSSAATLRSQLEAKFSGALPCPCSPSFEGSEISGASSWAYTSRRSTYCPGICLDGSTADRVTSCSSKGGTGASAGPWPRPCFRTPSTRDQPWSTQAISAS